jgi:hypothetical protein
MTFTLFSFWRSSADYRARIALTMKKLLAKRVMQHFRDAAATKAQAGA